VAARSVEDPSHRSTQKPEQSSPDDRIGHGVRIALTTDED
jgi:hypothetical protein